jgi:hypothetical protein
VPVAARLLTLTDHPGLDLIVVLNRVGDAADYARSGLVMEMPHFHDTLRIAHQRGADDAVPQAGGTLTFYRTFSRAFRAPNASVQTQRGPPMRFAGWGLQGWNRIQRVPEAFLT